MHLTDFYAPGHYDNPLTPERRARTIAAFQLATGDVERLTQSEMRRDVLNCLMSPSAVDYWLNKRGWLERTRKVGRTQLLRLTDKVINTCTNSMNGGGDVSTASELVSQWKVRMLSGGTGYERRHFEQISSP